MRCCEVDHHSHEYTEQQRADLDRVLRFNRDIVAAIDAARDVTAVEELLDPDPLRFMWVDEGDGLVPQFLTRARGVLDAAPALPGHRRVAGENVSAERSATRPAVAVRADGARLHVWLEWEPDAGERVVARLELPGGRPQVDVLTPTAGDCYRPTALFDADGTPWVFYARGELDRSPTGVAVIAHRLGSQGWTAGEQVSTTAHPSFNQEAAAHGDGRVEVVWQGLHDGRFGAWARTWLPGSGWGAARALAPEGSGTVWDPAVATYPDGRTAYAWTEYADNSYRTVVDLPLDEPSPDGGQSRVVRPLTSGTDYALHPSLAVTTDGSLWCAFDTVTVQGHGGSGPTRLRPAAEVTSQLQPTGARPHGEFIPADLMPDVSVRLQVLRVDAEGSTPAPGRLHPGLDVTPCGMPRLAADAAGGLTVAYRIHRRLPLMTYYWEVAAQSLGPDGWAPPTTFSGSDGNAEEVAVAALPDGALVAWQSDGRLERALTWTEGFGGRECPHLLDHQGEIIWHALHGPGQVRDAVVTSPGAAPAPQAAPRPAAGLCSDGRQESRRWLRADDAATDPLGRPRPTADVDGRRLQAYWGDLHRHSLISRCTSGDEPSLEDFYRYAWDVCDYDFWAVTDHSENSSAYQWWCIQKAADLFDVPGRFSPFYGFEWTGNTGHQNVIYGAGGRGAPIYSSYALGSQTPAQLWDRLRDHPEYPVITIPHHPGSAMVPFDWSYGDEEFLRVVEIFQSCRGNYEDDGCYRQYADGTLTGTFVLDGLRAGHRFGFIASSDHGNGASFLGAFADGLDRASIFEALQARRTFAATTRDVWVTTRIGDTFMGGQTTSSGPVRLEIEAGGYTDLAGIDVVRNGEVIAALRTRPDGVPEGWSVVPLHLEWGRGKATVDWSGGLRVHGGRVLATPFWAPEITSVGDDAVTWTSVTRSFGVPYGSQRGGLDLTVVAPPDAVVEIDAGPARGRVPVADLLAGSRDVDTAGNGTFTVGPGTGGLTSLGGTRRQLAVVDEPAGPAWYYARIFQVDGEIAWSSPIWVDPQPHEHPGGPSPADPQGEPR